MAVTLPDIPSALGKGLAHIHTALKPILAGLKTALSQVDSNADDALAGKIKMPVTIQAPDAGGGTYDATVEGEMISNKGALGALTINLPAVVVGMIRRVKKAEAGQDVILQGAAGDTVCGSDAGKAYKNVTDVGYIEIAVTEANTWEYTATPEGTWAVDNT